MARTNDLTAEQVKVARQLRGIRLQIGMGAPRFGKVIGMDSSGITHRELLRVPWKESEHQAALAAIIDHLKLALRYAEALSGAFTVQPSNPTATQNP